MATQYTPILKLALPVTGELSGTWGGVVNDNITSMVEQAVAGLATINTWTANAHTLTTANGTTSESRCAMLVADDDGAGNPSAAAEIICPALTKLYVLKNISGQQVTLKTSGGTGVAVANNQTAFLFCDGTNVNACVTTIVDGRITGNLTVDGNTTLGDSSADTITATARFASGLIPSADNTQDLGSSGNSWKDLYIDGTAYLALVDINGGTIDGAIIGGASPAAGTFTTATATTGNITTVNATTVDTTNIEVTNIKAKDGTASATIADSTGVMTIASSVLTTTDINGGTIDGAIIGGASPAAGTFTTATATTGNITTVNATTVDTTNIEVTNIKAKDGTASATIADSTGVMTIASSVLTTTDINGGTIDGTIIGGASAAAGTFTTATATTGNITTVNATTVDTTNIEVTNIKAKDGTASATIADSTGIMTIASSVLTTTDINGGTIDGTTIGGASAAAGTFTTATATTGNITTVNATTVDTTNIEVTNIKAKDGTASATIADSTGIITVSTQLNVDNLNLSGNTLSSTDTNGNIVLAPNGTGDVQLDADTVRIGDSNAAATITTNGTGNLTLSTNAGTNSGTIVINQGVNGNIVVTPNGTGDVYLDADTLRVGDSNAAATITTNGTGNLTLSTNAGTNSGTIVITQGVNGNIALTPNGTGEVDISKVDIDSGTIDATVIGGATRAAGSFTTLDANGNVTLGDATSDTITATGRFASDVVPSTTNTRSLGSSTLVWANVYATAFTESGSSLVAQTDIGTAPNEIPLNQYLGALAYVDTETPALAVGTGITAGTGTICKVNGGLSGGIYRVTILVDLTGLNSGGTAGDIIGVNGTANPCYIALLPDMVVLGGRMTCLETPAGGDTDIDLYSATEGTGVEDQAISALTETQIINAGTQSVGTVTYFAADPVANTYLYLVGQSTSDATYTAGRFLIEIFGVQ